MKKYYLLFVALCFIGILHAIAQSPATSSAAAGQSIIVTDSLSNPDNTSNGTIPKTGSNQQSIYTPTNQNNVSGTSSPSSKQASPIKEQPVVIDPKERN